LVDAARPERLRNILIALLPNHPEIDVYTDVGDIYRVPEGSVMILLPKAEDADFLNVNRPVFEARRLKVILWCEEATTQVLRRNAFDFYDWISHFHVCPFGAALHGVYGIREALCKRAPVIWWQGGDLEACFRVALPRRKLLHIDAAQPFAKIVHTLESNTGSWIVFEGVSHEHPETIDLALRQARRRGRVICNPSGTTLMGTCVTRWWIVSGSMDLPTPPHPHLIKQKYSERLFALCGYDPTAIWLAWRLLEDTDRAKIEQVLREDRAPRVALSKLEGFAPEPYAFTLDTDAFTEFQSPQARAVEAIQVALKNTDDVELAESASRRALHLLESAQSTQSDFFALASKVLGRALARKGHFREAEEKLRVALAIGSEQQDVLSDLTDVLTRQGRYAEAESFASRAVELAHGDVEQEKAEAALAHVRELHARSEGRGSG